MWPFFTFLSIVAICSDTVSSDLVPVRLKSALIGGCYDVVDDELVHCAAVEEECEKISKIRFKTANELTELGNYKCSTDKLPLGTCESTGQCAITKDSCAYPNDFRSPSVISGECNAEGRFVDGDFVPTQYGACKDGTTEEITCVLTPADCSEREAWISANTVRKFRNGGCKCHDVRIGVCKDGPNLNQMLSDCAISVDDCHPLMQTFGTARDVIDHTLMDCRLCPYGENLVADSGDAPLEDDNIDTLDEREKIKKDQQNVLKKAERDALTRGEKAGIIIGATTVFGCTLVLVSVFLMRQTTNEIVDHTRVQEII